MSLKLKTIKGVLWNSFEMVGGKIIQVFFTIVLARLLLPEDFGIIALLIIFTELSKVILDSGLSQALIRKKNVDDTDFSSVFYLNIILGFFLYIILFFSSPFLSSFYAYPELTSISRVLFLTLIFNSLGIVQNAKLVRSINFKVLANRTIIANFFSGCIAIILAFYGFGVWSLVWQIVFASFFRLILLWILSDWKPKWQFSFIRIKEFMPFSFRLLLSGIIDVVASNIQSLLIGKYYSKAELGFYSQSKLLSGIPSQTVTLVIKNVSYPSLNVFQDNVQLLKEAYRKVIRVSMFLVFPLLTLLIVLSKYLIPVILGANWIPAIPYFIILCIAGSIYPLYVINQNIFLVRGETSLYLRLSFIKRFISLFFVFITVNISVFYLVVGYLLSAIINSFFSMYISGKLIGYNFKEQFYDISGIILSSSLMVLLILFIDYLNLFENYFIAIGVYFIFGILFFTIFSYWFRLKVLSDLMSVLKISIFKST